MSITAIFAVDKAASASPVTRHAAGFDELYKNHDYKALLSTSNGTYYSYIVLLFNENPHFINILMDLTITTESNVSFEKLYLLYLNRNKELPFYSLAKQLHRLYRNPGSFDDATLREMEKKLESYDIVLRFVNIAQGLTLDYCIYGRKEVVKEFHPFLENDQQIYNIIPTIYYDEFFSSNSTFYRDLIYIDGNEVKNDYNIALLVKKSAALKGFYYIGSEVTPDIQFCLMNAALDSGDLEKRIERVFIVHELTHKIVNNNYKYYNSIIEEELAIASTMFVDPYLGLSALYSYLNYYRYSPHRIAALKFIKFSSRSLGRPTMAYNPSELKDVSPDALKLLAQNYFAERMELVKKKVINPKRQPSLP
ncbi:MAG: hypothetical protein PF637_07755 [Spirochaetes bacterium]|jgi:hypothetical protein|nr:hypothetical protein [Spirochaetota bacterium]